MINKRIHKRINKRRNKLQERINKKNKGMNKRTKDHARHGGSRERPTKGSGATPAPSPIGVRRSLAETQRLRGKRNRQTEERAAQRDNRERTRVTK